MQFIIHKSEAKFIVLIIFFNYTFLYDINIVFY